ncbi:MAG: hypothetical protein WDA21_00950 [Bacilli bacterium]
MGEREYQEYAIQKLQYDELPTGAIETFTGKSFSDLSFSDIRDFFTSLEYDRMKEIKETKRQIQTMYNDSNLVPSVVKGIQRVYTSGHNLLGSEYDNQERKVA